MAQTSGTVLAKAMTFYVRNSPSFTPVVFTCLIDAELSKSTATFDTTCKDSGAWSEVRPGTKSWSMTGSGNFAEDATFGYWELDARWKAQTANSYMIATANTGDRGEYGTAYVTELTKTSSGNDAAVTFSFTLTGTGELIGYTLS